MRNYWDLLWPLLLLQPFYVQQKYAHGAAVARRARGSSDGYMGPDSRRHVKQCANNGHMCKRLLRFCASQGRSAGSTIPE